MTHPSLTLQDRPEHHQVIIYFSAVVMTAVIAVLIPGIESLENVINPALAFMLFVTFLQVPLTDLGRAFTRLRFLGALLVTNFLIVPLLASVVYMQLIPMLGASLSKSR